MEFGSQYSVSEEARCLSNSIVEPSRERREASCEGSVACAQECE